MSDNIQNWRVEVNLGGSLHLTCWILKQRVIWWSSNLRHDEVEGEVLDHHVSSLSSRGEVLNHDVSSLSSLVESCTRDYRGIGGDRFHLSALKVLSVGNFSPIQRRILSDIFRQSSLKIVSLRNCNLMEEGILSGFWNLSSLVNLSLSNCSLTEGEILNHICHLSSLQNLSLDGNHFSSIPANIIQLSKLRSLCLNHCLKLLQIPELPPSLRVLDVHDCPCLETLSSPSSSLGLSLFKCFESAIEEWSYCQKKVKILMPGNNGIPEWISHKKEGSEIVVELPENWWEDNNFLGFALCSVFVPLHIESKEDSCLKCEMNFPHYFEYPDGFVTEFWSVDELSFRCSYPCCHNGGETNKVWVAYYPKVAIENKHWSNEWRHLKASFYGEEVKVEECGLHLIYKTNILNRDSNATNHWPRLSSENTDSNIELKCFESAIEEWSYCQKKVEILMPGNNGIPEWIRHKKKGSEIVVELPENWWEDNNFLGFALCSVIVPLHIETKEDPLSLKCELNFHHFYFEYPDGFVSEFCPVDELSVRCSYPCCHNGGESNRVWVACYPKVAIASKYWSNEFRHLKASFDGGVKVEECGLHLIYKTNILNRDSNATTIGLGC